MAERLGEAVLDLRADRKHLRSDLAGAKRDTDQAWKDIRKGSDKAAKFAGVALLAIGAAAYKATQSASDLGESINKSERVFGKAAQTMPGYGRSVAQSLGMSRAAALDAAAGIGAMLVPMGISQTEAAKMSSRMTTLAADLASLHNEDPTDMLDRLRAGLSGESEPLKQFGIVLTEARVKAEAMRLGIAKQGATLTEQQKIQARYSLAIRDAGAANGDFARTSGGLANQQRILKAEVADLSASLGGALLPAGLAVVGVLRDLAGWVDKNRTTTAVLVGVVGGLAAVVITVNGAMRAFAATQAAVNAVSAIFITRTVAQTAATEGAAVAQTGLNASMRANPIGIVVTALAALGIGLVIAYKKSETFRNIVQGAFAVVKTAAQAVVTSVEAIITVIQKALDLASKLNPFDGSGGTTTKDVVGKKAGAGSLAGVQRDAGRQTKSTMEKEGEDAGEAVVRGLTRTLERSRPRLALAITAGVRGAIADARRNVPTLAASLADSLGRAMDVATAKALAPYDPETGSATAGLRAMTGARDAAQQARTEAGLNRAIADAAALGNAAGPTDETPEQRTQRLADAQRQLTDAVVALNDYQADQAIAAEERRLAAERAGIEQAAATRKETMEQGLTDLADSFARGEIKQAAFTKRLNAIVRGAKGDMALAGKELGTAFTNAYDDALEVLRQQIAAIASGPHGKSEADPLRPTLVSPGAVQAGEWETHRKALDRTWRDLVTAAKGTDSPGGVKVTVDEQKAIDKAKAALDLWMRRKPLAAGGILSTPTLGWLAEAGVPEAVIPLDGSSRSWDLTAQAIAAMPGPAPGPSGPLVHVDQLVVRDRDDAQLVAAKLSRYLATQGVK
jgi:hypothetical protein